MNLFFNGPSHLEAWLLRIASDLLRTWLGFEILQSMPSSHDFSFSLRRESICLSTVHESTEGFQRLFLRILTSESVSVVLPLSGTTSL